jgi:hypothetical protein
MFSLWLTKQALTPKNWLYLAILSLLCFTTYKVYAYGEKRGEDKGQAALNIMQKSSDASIAKLNTQIANGEEIYRQSLLDNAKIQNDWSLKLQNAEIKANEAQAQVNTAITHNRILSDQLRDTTTEANSRARLPKTTDDAKSEYIQIANSVINDCSSKYLEMATTVSSQQIDVNKLVDAYPAQ